MPVYVHNIDLDRTPEIDAAMQWANEHDLEPRLISNVAKIEEDKYLQLESPTHRIANPAALVKLHQQNNFSRIIDAEGRVVARCQNGVYDFRLV